MSIAPEPSPPDTPHAMGNSTRGNVSEQPAFALVLSSTPSSSLPSQSIELVPEEEEEQEEAAGKREKVVWGGGDAPTTAPGVAVMGR